MYSLQRILNNLQLSAFIIQCLVNILKTHCLQHTAHSEHFSKVCIQIQLTVNTSQNTVCRVQFTVDIYNILRIATSAQLILYSIMCAVNSAQLIHYNIPCEVKT